MTFNERSRLFAVLNGHEVDRPPCASPLQTGTVELMRSADAYWPRAHNDPKAMARLSKAAHGCAGIESVRVPFDVTVDASAFGAEIGMATVDRQPAVLNARFPILEGLLTVEIPSPRASGRAPVMARSVRILASDRSLKDVPRICGVTGPFMLVCQLHGVEKTIMEVLKDPDGLRNAVMRVTEWTETFIEELVSSGAEIITLIDATTSGDLLSPEQYRSIAMECHRSIAQKTGSLGAYPILHVCGDISASLDLMSSCGFNGISVDQCMSISSVKRILRGRAACIGNIGPVSPLLMNGPPEVAARTIEAIENGTDVVAPGCGFAPRTPLSNMLAMVHATIRSAHPSSPM
ncbi:MAG: MtaA/CmuA family methyltransferase [Methanomassiliicoccales archaeon]|nr:MAG: MtaA/CmuA family methyltransferase [Methanomassiliicoccales archaeon]